VPGRAHAPRDACEFTATPCTAATCTATAAAAGPNRHRDVLDRDAGAVDPQLDQQVGDGAPARGPGEPGTGVQPYILQRRIILTKGIEVKYRIPGGELDPKMRG
jgi:hypothetical protein